MLGVDAGDNVLLLDGIVLQEESTDVYSVLDVVRSEFHLLAGLHGLGLLPEHIQNVLRAKVHPEHKTFGIDMRNESVVVGVACIMSYYVM